MRIKQIFRWLYYCFYLLSRQCLMVTMISQGGACSSFTNTGLDLKASEKAFQGKWKAYNREELAV